MKLSQFGEQFTSGAGILSLMDDLGNALATGGDDMIMMGGGNPGHVPGFQEVIQKRLQFLAADKSSFQKLIGVYDPPQGEKDFVDVLAGLLSREYGWDVGPENICLTNGSQAGFFLLFNMFAGKYPGGASRKIRLPLAPEYIGYADLGTCDSFFISSRPRIELLEDNQFKYHVDFENLNIGSETGAICVSRPTNPTGNVLTDDEIAHLDELAREHDVPLILDNAYGVPFPGIIYTEAKPVWNENIIVCLSLSKLGLPAARTGIIVARSEVVKAVSGMNAIMNLSTGSFGAMLAHEMVESGEVLELSRNVIKPFYQQKMEKAFARFHEELKGTPYKIHKPEGAMFLWLWFEDLPISSHELYQRLKARDVLVVSGHFFFPGLERAWQHQNECIRVTYSQDEELVAKGIKIIAEEVKKAYS
ncbi:MAG TPA: valine--pyruvate transaminase [Desulfocapsa sulfexigens]|nr:valine--pyruvate transaminase [Desulfocapsa sulfexigens]